MITAYFWGEGNDLHPSPGYYPAEIVDTSVPGKVTLRFNHKGEVWDQVVTRSTPVYVGSLKLRRTLDDLIEERAAEDQPEDVEVGYFNLTAVMIASRVANAVIALGAFAALAYLASLCAK